MLEPILNTYTLDAINNPCLQCLVEKLSLHMFSVTSQKGCEHAIPDALSHHPADRPLPDDEEAEIHIQHHTQQVILAAAANVDDGHQDHLHDPFLDELYAEA